MSRKPKVLPEVEALLKRAARKGFSPLALARASGIHHSTMRRWQLGQSAPTLTTLRAVQEFLTQQT
jgi:transcriptional regulator with XRE-family HTH domain